MKQWYTIPNGLHQNHADEGRRYALKKLIEFRCYPLEMVLDKLLIDKTTGERIIWATDSYSDFGDKYCDRYEITPGALNGMNPVLIQPRAFKALETQQQRTKSKAEVFTPSWIVNKMVNHLDEEWFGRSGVFNIEEGQSWQTQTEKIEFSGKKWKDYVDRSVLEITCGEAPFIVSRYNASTGEIIPIEDRIGILDRKLRIVTENTDNEYDWIKWTKRAYESVYGYEFQGDNLLIGRANLLLTFIDYYQKVWNKEADKSLLTAITNIITWNFWQMDGLNGTVPLGAPQPMFEQMTLFDFEDKPEEKAPLCKVRKWRMKKTILYKEHEEKEGNVMARKFDVVIGNPPYQEEQKGTVNDKPVYNLFMDESYKIADIVELITPARFLFKAGATPKQWNEKMLNDPHFKVITYAQKSSDYFPNVDIKGGVAITYRDSNTYFGPVGAFCSFEELNNIKNKVLKHNDKSLMEIVSNRGQYRYSNLAYEEQPEEMKKTPDKRISTSAFDRMPKLFTESKPEDNHEYIQIYGKAKNSREYRWFRKDYLNHTDNLYTYKVILPKANGSGAIGEVLSTPLIGAPLIGATETFITIGSFKSEDEARNLLTYIKTKFARTMLGILKITQDNTKEKWQYVPMQNFTSNSDIDWSKSIPEIDQQLYKKYNLSPDEIEFIETHVKEME